MELFFLSFTHTHSDPFINTKGLCSAKLIDFQSDQKKNEENKKKRQRRKSKKVEQKSELNFFNRNPMMTMKN